MTESNIKSGNWKEFFDDFSKRNHSRLVNVEIFSELGAQKEVRKMPLSGIVFETDKRNSSFLEIMLENRRDGVASSHLTHFIPNVTRIFSEKYVDGCDEAIEIEDASGNKTLLTFAQLPELTAGAFYAVAGRNPWQ